MAFDFSDEAPDARGELAGLALKALDVIEEQYGDDATLGDALLIFEVTQPEDDEVATYTHRVSTSDRATVIQGLVTTCDKSLGPDV